jgi:2,3-bisphosphoglycerate-dependent phosphoglycerate mutase
VDESGTVEASQGRGRCALNSFSNTTVIYLLRHAQNAPDTNVAEALWPLSKDGIMQAERIVPTLLSLRIGYICSSPFKRALDTVAPFAEQAGLQVQIAQDLRERKLKEDFVEDFLEVLRQTWLDFEFALPNCESSRDCQDRIRGCIDGLVAEHSGENVLVSSHGNAIGLFLNALDSTFGFDEWSRLRNPDMFKIDYTDDTPKWDRSFVFPTEPNG